MPTEYRGSNRNKLDITPQISSVAMNVIKIMIQKVADTLKDELLLGGEICYVTATSQYHVHFFFLLVCVSLTITGQPRNSIFIRRV